VRVDDGSQKATLLGVGRRLRLPRLTAADIAAIPYKQPGELIYNADVNRAQVWDGQTWQNFW